METILNSIGGRAVEPQGGGWLDNVEPATGEVYGRIPDSGPADVAAAVDAARAAFPAWSATPAEERARWLTRIAEVLEQRVDALAADESRDNGKPLALARTVDVPRAARNLRFFAGAVQHTASELHVSDRSALNYTLRRPRGVAGCISPWNLPLYLFTWKIAPALASGNTVVAKPSEVTPLTAWRLGEICRELGLPDGVLNIVHGRGATAGAALVAHPDVPAISFTGGTATGEAIVRSAGPMFKKLSLELGGKNPNVVFADADRERALAETVRAAFSNQGQICLCGSRILIEREAYEPFVEGLVERARALRVGDPLDPATEQGALVSRAHLDKVRDCIATARAEGGEVLCGGGPPAGIPERCAGGFFLEPTVVAGLPLDCRTNQQEIFGPVVTVMPFDDEAQALELANGTPYGLAATVWTRDLARAHRFAEGVDAGIVWINCWMHRDLRVPFGGMKASGVGREGGEEALRFFTEPKNVCIALEDLEKMEERPQ